MSTCKERCMAQLTCPICTELFVEATMLSCTHIFCHDCIESWNRGQKNRACPVCSKPVTSMIRSTGLDDLIENMIADFRDFPPELKNKRKERMQEREASEKKA
ncbi:PREDICTED: E3 ubiquitin-protein ligase RNF8-like [Wasmannia auropunctata]|uniref:E3 ubiquitin-protein ligase RNF8-like n=1 Tax=Wasmannia auropunctata TaxID=64793 RepID=UPI0005EFDEBA|nr:PREDICTED: E3 ubiquitin-protein ligase RNF8-like [Wasmannia auropunctata]